ncbi:hypothetical protein D3C78_1020890 [compost metagenome]
MAIPCICNRVAVDAYHLLSPCVIYPVQLQAKAVNLLTLLQRQLNLHTPLRNGYVDIVRADR